MYRSFSRNLEKFRSGQLIKSEMKRDRPSVFEPVKEKLIKYIELRSRLYQQDKCGLSYILKEKAVQWAKDLKLPETFMASNGFISSLLKREGKISVALHGEAMEMSPEEQQENLAEFRKRLNHLIEKHNVDSDRIYNADQTGLYYNKLPNRIYINKEQKNDFRGVKQMKSKDRVTLMVCTAANGEKLPLLMIGHSANPICFKYQCENGRPPMSYTHQANAWFDRKITVEWINRVLWPHHLAHHGDVCALLVLDNCSAHKDLELYQVFRTS
ncbi:MAG: hypothetical protein ACREOZ_02400 [Gloeomargaritales cyanobacterium]